MKKTLPSLCYTRMRGQLTHVTESKNSFEKLKIANGMLFCFARRGGQTKLRYGIRHVYMGDGKFDKQTRCRNTFEQEVGAKRIILTEHINERAIATSITVNRQRIMLMGVHFHHTEYADPTSKRAYKSTRENHKLQENHANRRRKTSTLNLVPVLDLNASVLDRMPSKNQTAEEIG